MRHRRYLALAAAPLLTLAACVSIAGLDGEFTVETPDGSPSSTSTSTSSGDSSSTSSSGGSDSSTSSASSGDGSTTSSSGDGGTTSSGGDGSTTSSSGDSGPDSSAPKDSAVDTGPPAPDAKADATTNPNELLMNSDFASGCTSWQNNEATLSPNAAFRSSPGSCGVCGKVPTNPWSILQSFTVTKKGAGRVYKFEAYVRTDPSLGTAADYAACELKVLNASGGLIQQDEHQIGPGIPSGTWTPCSISMTLNAQAGANAATILAIVNGQFAGKCFLVDDASLTTSP